MKPVYVNPSMYIDFNKENNDKDPKVLQNVPDWSEETFMFKILKILSRGHMLLVILKRKKFLEHFTENNCKE